MQLMRAAAIVVAILVGLAGHARADGELAMRGIYYKERSTRVVQPMLDGKGTVGENGEVDGHLLVDAITSASVAAGAAGEPFTEKRLEFGGGYLHRLLDRFRVGTSGRWSREPDYDSWFLGTRGDVALFDDNLVLGIAYGYGFDQITSNAPNMRTDSFEGRLRNHLVSGSVSQLLSPRLVVGVTYDWSYLNGTQHSPYRSVRVDGVLVPEAHPRQRTRNAVAGSLRWLGPADTTVIASYRNYRDDWGVRGHTPELRIVKEVDAGIELGLRYRFHWQRGAEFFRDDYEMTDQFFSDDVKLSDFTTHTIAVKMAAYGRALGFTDRMAAWRGEMVFEYVDQNNRFGNAGIVHASLVVPFEY